MEQEKLEQEKPENILPDFEVSFEDIELPETVEEETQEESEEETPKYGEESDDTAIGVYETLREKSIIFEDEESPFDGTWESLEKHLDELPNKVASSILDHLPSPAQKLMDYAMTKENLTHEDLKKYFKLQDEDYNNSNISVNSIEEARSYLSSKLKQQGFEPDIIDVTLDAYEDKGEEYILNKAKTMSESEKSSLAQAKLDEEKQARLDRQKRQEEYFTAINNELNNLKYTDTRNRAIKDNLNPKIISAKNAAIQSSPKAIIQLADFYSYFDAKTGEFNLEKFAEMAASKEVNNFKKSLISNHFSSSGAKNSGKRHQENTQGDVFEPIF